MKSPNRILFGILISLLLVTQGLAQSAQKKTTIGFGAKLATQYNYKLLHNTAALNLNYKNSNFFIGPEHTHFFSNYYDGRTHYEKNALGLYFGYNYSFKTIDRFSFFLQTAFSIFPSNYSYYQMGLAEWIQHKEWIVQNTASIGTRFKVDNHIRLLLDAGFGSLQGFFIMVDTFVPTVALSIEFV